MSGYVSLWWCDGVNIEARALMGKGLFVTDLEAFRGCEYVEKQRECLRLSKCGLRGMIYEFGES